MLPRDRVHADPRPEAQFRHRQVPVEAGPVQRNLVKESQNSLLVFESDVPAVAQQQPKCREVVVFGGKQKRGPAGVGARLRMPHRKQLRNHRFAPRFRGKVERREPEGIRANQRQPFSGDPLNHVAVPELRRIVKDVAVLGVGRGEERAGRGKKFERGKLAECRGKVNGAAAERIGD